MNVTIALARELRAELARQRRSQAELAAALHMTQPQISRRLSAATPITVDDLAAICGYLGVGPGSLLDQVSEGQEVVS